MQLLLPPSHIPVYGAYLKYGGGGRSDSPLNVTLTVGANERVFCVQVTGPVPTSVEWYNPQGQLVSRNTSDEVNQVGAFRGRAATLTFQSYQQSQGGKYECKVDLPANNTEKLLAFIGECYTLCDCFIKSENGIYTQLSCVQPLCVGLSIFVYLRIVTVL